MKTHGKQVAAWGKLLGHCNDQGDSYNPGTASMNRTAMESLLEESQKSIDAVHKAKNDVVTAVNQRQRAFDQLPFLGTRVIGALKASGAPANHVADVDRIRRKFRSLSKKRGALSNSDASPSEGVPANAEAPSTSAPRKRGNLAFESRLQNFSEMIGLLQNDSPYQPHEADLSIEGLTAMLEDLRVKHKAVDQARVALTTARHACNELLFSESGIYGIAKMVKEYFKSVFGARSETFKAIQKIKFVKR